MVHFVLSICAKWALSWIDAAWSWLGSGLALRNAVVSILEPVMPEPKRRPMQLAVVAVAEGVAAIASANRNQWSLD